MALRINTIKISGMPAESGWSQSYDYSSGDSDQTEQTSLMIVFSTIRNDIELGDAVIGRELLNQFRKLYSSDKNKSPDLALKETVKKIFDDFFQKLDGLEIAAAGFVNDILYTACINGGKASLYRDGFLVKILDSNSPQMVSASGYPKEGDTMILATADLHKKMSYFDIKNALSKGLENASEEFSIHLHNTPTAGVCLVSFIKNGKNSETTVNEEIKKEEKETFSPKARIRNLKSSFSGIIEKIKLLIPRRRIYLNRQSEEITPSGNKKAAIVGLILIVLLGVSVFFGVYKNKKDNFKDSYADTLSSARTNIEDAIQLKDVEVKKSRESFLLGKNLIKKMQDDKIEDPEIDRLNALVLDNEEKILGERKVTSDMWLDLSLIVDGFKSQTITYFEDSLGYTILKKE